MKKGRKYTTKTTMPGKTQGVYIRETYQPWQPCVRSSCVPGGGPCGGCGCMVAGRWASLVGNGAGPYGAWLVLLGQQRVTIAVQAIAVQHAVLC